MADPRLSYLKSIVLVGGAGAAAAAVALFLPMPVAVVVVALIVVPALLVVVGGFVVLARERNGARGAPDLFARANAACSESAILARRAGAGPLRRLIARSLLGHDLLVGDTVRVRSLADIRATLDAQGCINGMPFMPEMERYCGRTARVFRSIDKAYDYGKSKQMRRLDGCVLLCGWHCDGSAHDGCQAGCYLIFNVAWLERVPATGAADAPVPTVSVPAAAMAPAHPVDAAAVVHRCQFTSLTAATTPLSAWNVGKDLRPLVAGNFTSSAFLIALFTRLFNLVQRWRRGTTYPRMPAGTAGAGAAPPPELAAGDWIRVRSPAEIASTLNAQNKNRGLWFDLDMLKHCGQTYRVDRRVDRIIDVVSCRIITMKTPCFVLEGVCYSGEFQYFGPQHEDLYWRAVWFERQGGPRH